MLIDSKLSVDTLGKIWDLADMDKDGKLDQHEFAVVRIFNLYIIIYFSKVKKILLGYAFSI